MANLQDPRKSESQDTVNETLQDRLIRHLLFLTRLATQQARWITDRMDNDILPEISGRVVAAIDRLLRMGGPTNLISQAQARQLQVLNQDILTSASSLIRGLRDAFIGNLVDIAKNEVEFEQKLITKTIPIEWTFSVPTDRQLQTIITTQPFDGKPLNEWFSDMSNSTASRVTAAVRQGMIEGEGIPEIMRRIRGSRASNFTDGVLGTTKRHAEALARTSVIHTSNQATQELYRQNSDLIKSVVWVATLDSRTCVQCMALDGETFDIDKGQRPPAHVNCRCTSTPVTKSWRELGIDLDEAPEGTRASMNGQVPQSLTYNQWLRRQQDRNPDIVVEALGPTRAKLFLDGKLSVSQFTDRQGNILTLEEIRRKEADVFEELGITLR